MPRNKDKRRQSNMRNGPCSTVLSATLIVSAAATTAHSATTHTGSFSALGGAHSSASYSGAGYHGTGHGHGAHSSATYSGVGGGESNSLSQALGFHVFQTDPAVVGRYLFYNDSGFDGSDAAANAADDQAIASGKSALARNEKADFENITSYQHGINGLFIDVQNPAGELSLDDFSFRIGNNNSPNGWSAAPEPLEFVVRDGAGTGGSTRVAVTWSNGAVKKTWLEVTVKANASTGLETADIFYFGSAVGKTPGDSDALVGAQDELRIRNNPRGFFNQAPVDFAYDLNRDGLVNATDQLIARSNVTGFFSQLQLITPADD